MPNVNYELDDAFYYMQSKYLQNFSIVVSEAYLRTIPIEKIASEGIISLSEAKETLLYFKK